MAVWVKCDGSTPQLVSPAAGAKFTLAELQKYVGGNVEMLRLTNRLVLWLDEDSKIKGLPLNVIADHVVASYARPGWSDYIAGDALLTDIGEIETD